MRKVRDENIYTRRKNLLQNSGFCILKQNKTEPSAKVYFDNSQWADVFIYGVSVFFLFKSVGNLKDMHYTFYFKGTQCKHGKS